MEFKVCTRCQGKRITMDMGFIEKTCATCDGKGYVEDKTIKEKVKKVKHKKTLIHDPDVLGFQKHEINIE